VLQAWGIPVRVLDARSDEGQQLVANRAIDGELPFLFLSDGRILTEATLSKVTDAMGYGRGSPSETFDVVVLGLGPAGMSAAVNAASEGLRVMVVEWTQSQAASSPMIRNYVGFPAGVTGAELLRRAWYQAAMFGFEARVGRYATNITSDGDQHVVGLDDGSLVRTRSIVLATGAEYRRISIPSVDDLLGRGVFYGYGAPEAQALTGEPVAIVGGANSAVQAAAHLARYARQVRLIVRGGSLSDSASDYLVQQVASLDNVTVHLNTQVAQARDRQQLRSLILRDTAAGTETEYEVTGLFILIGASPRTDWLPSGIARDEKGYVLTGDDVAAAASAVGAAPPGAPLQTSVPGIFAAGDVRAGSVKRVAPAVGEGAAAIAQLVRYLGSVDSVEPAVPVGAASR
jgi:thioredoxin reductase (NADPH)